MFAGSLVMIPVWSPSGISMYSYFIPSAFILSTQRREIATSTRSSASPWMTMTGTPRMASSASGLE
jgi:hypothetical protein